MVSKNIEMRKKTTDRSKNSVGINEEIYDTVSIREIEHATERNQIYSIAELPVTSSNPTCKKRVHSILIGVLYVIILGFLSVYVYSELKIKGDKDGDINWTEWSSWTPCNVECGKGFKRRIRICTNHMMSRSGQYCNGNDTETEECQNSPCLALHIRLVDVDGSSGRSGRVEVSLDRNIWGTVCNDSFTQEGAHVVCRMLGYNTSSAQVLSGHSVTNGEGPIFLGEVECTGHENSLLFCKHAYWNDTNCDHSEDVGVSC